jgi:hypothetical protein
MIFKAKGCVMFWLRIAAPSGQLAFALSTEQLGVDA